MLTYHSVTLLTEAIPEANGLISYAEIAASYTCQIMETSLALSVYICASFPQWRTQDFRMGEVEMPQATRGWGVEEGLCPLPTGGRVWGGSCAPSPEIFSYFFC